MRIKILPLVIVIAVLSFGVGCSNKEKKKVINTEDITEELVKAPASYEESLTMLDQLFSEEKKQSFKEMTEDEFLVISHDEIEPYIINNWLRANPHHLTESFHQIGYRSVNDMATTILKGYYRKLNNLEALNLLEEVHCYQCGG